MHLNIYLKGKPLLKINLIGVYFTFSTFTLHSGSVNHDRCNNHFLNFSFYAVDCTQL